MQIAFPRKQWKRRADVRGMVGHISLGTLFGLEFLFLKIYWNRDMSHAAVGKRGAASQINDVFHMGGAHDAFVVNGDINEQLIQRDILLGVRTNQVVELQASNSQHRLMIELGIIKSVEQMNSTRTRGSQADS